MNDSLTKQPIVIFDFGSQYTQLIGRRIRECGVYCEIHPWNITQEAFKNINPIGVILSGGPSSSTDKSNPQAPLWLFNTNLPILGICYGMQTMAIQWHGIVETSADKEFGYAKVLLHNHCELLLDIEDSTAETGESLLDVWMSHGDKVTKLPEGFSIICSTKSAPIAGMAHNDKPWYGLQFHPEVTHTLQGKRILQRFAVDICKATTHWNPGCIIESSLKSIKNSVGKDRVLLALSGGVDSSVVAALLHRAIGSQLTCVFVDTGLLRLNEVEQVQQMFGNHLGINLITVDAKSQFFNALKGIQCPEKKRKIIGHTFIEVFDKEAEKLSNIKWLAQGTIYPDVIESSAASKGTSVVIKSHHNVGGLPEELNLKLLEPIRLLFKDEVRKLGLELGLPYDMVYRHPFPGPGLGVRILGEVKEEFATILRKADAIFIEELRTAALYDKVSQAFAVFLPVKSVGVAGDGRRYDYVVCLRAVETVDFMTAHWAQLPWEFLSLVSHRIINEVEGVSRVTYDISGKPPATIEWE